MNPRKPLKILLMIRSLEGGGAERQCLTLAQALRAQGHEVEIFVFYDRGIYLKSALEEGLKVVSFAKKGRWDIGRWFLRLRRYVKYYHPDVIYSFMTSANCVAAMIGRLTRIPVVWGIRYSSMDMQQYDLFSRLAHKIEDKLVTYATHIICNSTAGMEASIARGFPATKLSVVSNGIDTTKYYPLEKGKQKLRQQLDLPKTGKIIGMVARFDPMKDHSTFLQAAQLVIKNTKESIHFLCIGAGSTHKIDAYKRLAKKLRIGKYVIFLPLQEDVTSYYHVMDVCCLASQFGEGFPNVLGEALACGIPCVATNVGDSTKVVDRYGAIAPPQDSASLAAALEKVLTTKYDSKRLHKHIATKFSPAILAQASAEILQKAVHHV